MSIQTRMDRLRVTALTIRFLVANAAFFITDPGITADTQVSNVVFSFGTEAGTNVPANTPDSGATVALLGLALMGLAAARAKFRKA